MALKEKVHEQAAEIAPVGVWRIVLWACPKVRITNGAFPLGNDEWASTEGFETEAEAEEWSLHAHHELSAHEFFSVTIEIIGPRYFPAPGEI